MNQQLLLATILVTLSLHSAAFGTLLSSPDQRALLDKKRQNSRLNPPSVQHAVKAVVANKTISFEGMVTRHKGPATIWLNGQVLDQGGIGVSLPGHKDGAITVALPSAQKDVLLKPGQVIRPDNRAPYDTYLQQSRNLYGNDIGSLDSVASPERTSGHQ